MIETVSSCDSDQKTQPKGPRLRHPPLQSIISPTTTTVEDISCINHFTHHNTSRNITCKMTPPTLTHFSSFNLAYGYSLKGSFYAALKCLMY
ncbi:hypothetical protein CK203_034177 [Vitis vinifera]|uniref:Uncharacterized protein n=1 Tax=Vitis vinifera TaxID=29760 RepID=A0A438IFS7_VITVI|nr:hypothetical protein CK203_034177 [Vitis vinifera]